LTQKNHDTFPDTLR